MNLWIERFQETLKAVEADASLSSDMQGVFVKTMILGVASYFEKTIQNHVKVFVGKHIPVFLIDIFSAKVITQQYHTWFEWDKAEKGCNKFFSLFGCSFKEFMKRRIGEKSLDDAITDFIELGQERNILVHNHFLESTSNKTLQEIYDKFNSANKFVVDLPFAFIEYTNNDSAE